MASQKTIESERTLLLSHEGATKTRPRSAPATHKPYYNRIVLLLSLVLILIQSGDQLATSPQARIAEAILCYRHYELADPTKLLIDRANIGPGAIGGVDEELCKVDAVQSQLSSLRGYQSFFDGGPSLLLALPFGWAADKYGRKPFLFLGALSFVLRAVWKQTVFWFWQSFDIQWTWASALHGLMAGSSPVISALFFVMVSDVVPETERSKVFFRLGGANLAPEVFMPLLSAWLMNYTPWIPSVAGTLSLACAACLVLFIPETLDYRCHETDHPDRSDLSASEIQNQDPQTNLKSHSGPSHWLQHLKVNTAFLRADWRVPALVVTFVFHLAMTDCGPLQLQYVSKRYHLTLSEATIRLTIRSVATVALLFLILPFASDSLTKRWKFSNQRSDLLMARASIGVYALGWLCLGLAPTISLSAVGMGIMALGSGSMFLVRSFLTPLVPAHNVARLYSLISVVDTLGAMLGLPLLASLFNRGLAAGGLGIGLPFYFLGLTCFLIFVLLCIMGVKKGDDGLEEDEEVGREG